MIVLHSRWWCIMVAAVALSIAVPAIASMPDRNVLRDELVNRPAGPLACLPTHAECDMRW